MPGPLPEPGRRRRNPPAIPTTTLPVSGRKGRPPKCPYELGRAGATWWKWAWATPQACAWDASAVYTAARRALLEDDLAALSVMDADRVELAELIGVDDENEQWRALSYLVGRLKSLAGNEVTLMKEMRELDGKLGLNPEALAKLRWKIVADEKVEAEPKAPAKKPAAKKAGRQHLRAV